MCAVYGGVAVTDQTCYKWFVKLRAGDSLLDNAPWPSRPAEAESDQIETPVENNQHSTTQEIANILKNIQINKVIGENEKCVFYFTEKIIQTYWPTQ